MTSPLSTSPPPLTTTPWGGKRTLENFSKKEPKKLRNVTGLKGVKVNRDKSRVIVPPGVKMSTRQREKHLVNYPMNQEGMPEALGYTSPQAYFHAIKRSEQRQYARDLKTAALNKIDPNLLNAPEAIDPIFCSDDLSCEYCAESDSSSDEDEPFETYYDKPKKTVKDLPILTHDDVYEIDVYSDSNEGALLMDVEEFSDDDFSQVLGVEPLNAVSKAVLAQGAGTSQQGLHNQTSLKHVEHVSKESPVTELQLPVQLERLQKQLSLANAKCEGLKKKINSLNSKLDVANTLQVKMEPLKGLDHHTHFKDEAGLTKLKKGILSVSSVGLLGPTLEIASGKFLTARNAYSGIGDPDDTKGVREFFLHARGDAALIGNPYNTCIPLSVVGMKRLLMEYDNLIKYLTKQSEVFVALTTNQADNDAHTCILESSIRAPSGNHGSVTLTCKPPPPNYERFVTFRFDFIREYNPFTKASAFKTYFHSFSFTASSLTFLVRDILPFLNCMDAFHAVEMGVLMQTFNLKTSETAVGPHKINCNKNKITEISLEHGFM